MHIIWPAVQLVVRLMIVCCAGRAPGMPVQSEHGSQVATTVDLNGSQGVLLGVLC